MAKRISELDPAVAIDDSDEIELNQGGASRKATRGQLVAGLATAAHAHTLADLTDSGALAALDAIGSEAIEAGAAGAVASGGAFDPGAVLVDATRRFAAYDQAGPIAFLKATGTFRTGVWLNVPFRSNGAALTWTTDFVYGPTGSTADLIAKLSALPARPQELYLAWDGAKIRVWASIVQASEVPTIGARANFIAAEPQVEAELAAIDAVLGGKAPLVAIQAAASGSLAGAASGSTLFLVGDVTAVPVDAGWRATLRNKSGSARTITPASGVCIRTKDGTIAASVTLGSNKACLVEGDGTDLFVDGEVT